MRSVPLFLFASFLATATAAKPALAEFETSYAGAACQAQSHLPTSIARGFGSFNMSTDPAGLSCPAVKHYNTDIQGGTAVVIDRRTDAEVVCRLFSVTPSGE